MLNTEGLAILLIDMQKRFVVNLRQGERERIISNQIKVLECAIRHKVPIIVFEGWPDQYSDTIEELMKVVEKSENYDIMSKFSNDAFTNCKLKKRLDELKVKRLLIMGVNACYCIRSTAEGAIKNGFRFVTSNDLISGMEHHKKHNDIPWFKANGTCLESIEEIFELQS